MRREFFLFCLSLRNSRRVSVSVRGVVVVVGSDVGVVERVVWWI
jgi:hypothetical protein